MNIKEIIEMEAGKRAEDWAKDRKIITGKYPTVEEYLQVKYEFFKALCRKVYNELKQIVSDAKCQE